MVLIGLDGDTVGFDKHAQVSNHNNVQVGLLVQKLKAKDRVRYLNLVAGYTWWKRILKHTNLKHK